MADIVVIGGGAAGMAAALFAARAGASVILLEKNEKLGKKVYITGKGRCNLTNDCDTDEFMAQVPRNPRFLYSALSFFSPQDMMSLLESAGCPVQVQRGRRVFPVSEKASDVTRALQSCLRNAGVTIRLGAEVQSLESEGGRISGAAAFAGGVLGIKPVLTARDGRLAILGKARGSKKANNLLAEQIRRDGVDFSMPLLLGYTGLSDNTLRQYIQDSQSLWQGQVSDLDCVQLSSVVGTHAGPGAVAVAYFKSGEVK